jgi:hypothetical protein
LGSDKIQDDLLTHDYLRLTYTYVRSTKGQTAEQHGHRPLDDVWHRFLRDKETLEKHGVTEEELSFLHSVSLMGSITTVKDILFILKNIRSAGTAK